MEEIMRLVKAATVWFERENGQNAGIVPLPAEEPAVEKEKKARKPRAVKEEVVPAVEVAPAAPVVVAPVVLNEAQSSAKLLELAREYIGKVGGQESVGFAALKSYVAASFNVSRLTDLVHEQRLRVITHIEGELKKIS